MRVAVIVVSMLVVATPSEASKSCMSKNEARQNFGAVHIYWHGPNHCWNATPTSQRHQIEVQRKPSIREVRQTDNQPKWRDSMSRMLADTETDDRMAIDAGHRETNDTIPATPWINRWIDIGPSSHPLDARWVDIPQATPLVVIERKPEPMISHVVLLVLIAMTIALTLATIEFVFRRTACL